MLRLLLLVLFLGSSAGASAQSVGGEVRPLLRRGTSKAEVLESWSPPRLRALNRRVQFIRTEGTKEGCPPTTK